MAAPSIDYAVGGAFPIRLKDGSMVYSAKAISDLSKASIQLGGEPYKTNGLLNQGDAINAYRKLLLWIKSQGVEPILLMTPYHENVLKAPNSLNAKAIHATEPLVISLADELGIKVIGSYDPKIVGCLNNEFFDAMHPTAACLAKLRPRQ